MYHGIAFFIQWCILIFTTWGWFPFSMPFFGTQYTMSPHFEDIYLFIMSNDCFKFQWPVHWHLAEFNILGYGRPVFHPGGCKASAAVGSCAEVCASYPEVECVLAPMAPESWRRCQSRSVPVHAPNQGSHAQCCLEKLSGCQGSVGNQMWSACGGPVRILQCAVHRRPQQGRDGAVCAGISCLHRCLSYFIYIRLSHNFHLGWMNLWIIFANEMVYIIGKNSSGHDTRWHRSWWRFLQAAGVPEVSSGQLPALFSARGFVWDPESAPQKLSE